MKIAALNQEQTERAMSFVVLLAISFVAYVDSTVAPDLSLGYLYLVPLVLSASIHGLHASIALAVICVALRETFGPFDHEWRGVVVRSARLSGAFLLVVTFVHRLGSQRRALARTVRDQRDQLSQDLDLAAAVQRRLLPQEMPNGPVLEIRGCVYPSRIVGGDFYDCIEIDEQLWELTVGDVAGKGTPAAMLMPAIMGMLRMTARRTKSPANILRQLNTAIHGITEENHYASLFCGVIDAQSSSLKYCNGGHPPPVLVRAASGEHMLLEAGGPVVGLLPQASFNQEMVELRPGDTVVLYSDGLTEAENSDGEQYGLERAIAIVKQAATDNAESILQALHNSAVAFTGNKELADDLTIVVCRIGPEFGRTS